MFAAGVALSSLGARAQQPSETLPGFKADQLFDGSGIERVNVYSGDVQVSVPLGPEYALGSGVTWQLAAHYSNHYWNLYRQECGIPIEPCFLPSRIQHGVLAGRSTLGAGWSLDVGYIIDMVVSDPESLDNGPRYHAPDGSVHPLNHKPAGFYETDDGLVARFRYPAGPSNGWSMELPDGSTWWFEHQTATPWSPNGWDFFDGPHPGSTGTSFGLSRIEDRYDSTRDLLNVNYESATSWQVDSIQMGSRLIDFSWGTFETAATASEPARDWPVLTEIVFPVAASTPLTVSFGREDRAISRTSFESLPPLYCSGPLAPTEFRAPFLKTLTVGERVYGFTFDSPIAGYGGAVLTEVALPTGGKVAYEYGTDLHGRTCRRGALNCPSVEDYVPPSQNMPTEEDPTCSLSLFDSYVNASPSATKRTETDPVTSVSGYTEYHRGTVCERENPNSTEPDLARIVRIAVVERPNGNGGRFATKHFFSVGTQGGPSGIELERRTYDGASVGAGVSPVRSTVFCYDTGSTSGLGACGVTEAALGPPGTSLMIPEVDQIFPERPRREVTWYGVNPAQGGFCDNSTATTVACWSREHDEWNQQAREFRQETTRIPRVGPSLVLLRGGQWGRRTTTIWAPSESPRWLPKFYTSRTVEDLYDAGAAPNEPSSVTTSYSFDTNNGKFLSSTVADGELSVTHQLSYGTPEGPDPVLESLLGNEKVSGIYRTTRTFQNGLALTSRRTEPEDLEWNQFRADRDASTDVITTSYDPNGISTGYTWDALGRLTGIQPTDDAFTQICYLPWVSSTPTTGAHALVKTGLPSGCGTPLLTPAEGSGFAEAYVYDGFGRLMREIRLLPTSNSGSYLSVRVTTRNDAGLVASVSEWSPCGSGSNLSTCFLSGSSNSTTYSDFDVFGRPQAITLPDSTQITKAYDDWEGQIQLKSTDTRENTYTSNVAGGQIFEWVRKDLFGRPVIAAEPTKVTNPLTIGPLTLYRHDIHDQVAEVKQERTPTGGTAYTQTRTFSRNVFGFLTSETQPESGTTTYSSFNALGLPKTKTNGGVTIDTTYDALGRVLTVSEGGSNTIKNTYDESLDENQASRGSYKGKLTTAISWNKFPSGAPKVPWNDFYPRGSITDSYTYSGSGGRLSQKRTSLSNGTVSTVASWTYNGLGLVENEAHPRIDPAYSPSLVVTTKYTAGLPTKVAVGTQAVVSSATYDPAGGLASYTAGSGVLTTIAPDPNRMARPSQISTAGGRFNTGLYLYDGAGNVLSTGADEFTYDAASRLRSAKFGSNEQIYKYDDWGNLNYKNRAIVVAKETNRLTSAIYDSRGNVTTLGNEKYSYDGLGRQVRHDNEGVPTYLGYLFDPANERIVKALTPSTGTPVLRREMARIVLQSLRLTPVAKYPPTFTDVQLTDPDRGWIERFWALGFTGGCEAPPNQRFCPNDQLTRGEMAVFLAKAMVYPGGTVPDNGKAGASPYECRLNFPGDSLFQDVPKGDGRCKYVHFMYASGVTGGCSSSPLNYCPAVPVTHWMMEVFVSKPWAAFTYVPPGSTYTFRGPNGLVLTEFQDTTAARSSGYVSQDHVYLGKQLVGTKDASGWMFHVTDHLGSVRLTTNSTGGVVKSRKYWPWGEETTTSGPLALGFAGMERDLETEYTSPRYYDHARSLETGFGRFLSPDLLSGNVGDPQSWNRYTYARNNPLKYVDPDGRETSLAFGQRTASNAVGHVAIVIDDRVYSYGTRYTGSSKDWGASAGDYLAAQSNDRATSLLRLGISSEQEAALKATLDANNPNAPGAPKYDMVNNSCVTVSERALEKAGVLPNQPGPVKVGPGGALMQAGAPSSVLPAGLVKQVQDAGLVRNVEQVGTPTKVYWTTTLWNTLKELLK
jgi:RHS repeat-associated protein